MYRRLTYVATLAIVSLCVASPAWAQQDLSRPPDPLGANPPVFQTLGMVDTETQFLDASDCRFCHDSGVPDRHHVLYGQSIPNGSSVPYRDSNGDGSPDATYSCLSCHGQTFTVERDCFGCHSASASPHHSGPDVYNRQCSECHGSMVNDFDDGHIIPTYNPSLVTPWTGLYREGWNDDGTKHRQSNGSGLVGPTDVLVLETGFTFALGEVVTRTYPIELVFKPADPDNDFSIAAPRGVPADYVYNVVFLHDAGLSLPVAAWDAATDTLTVTLADSQTAQQIIDKINGVAPPSGRRVRATKLLTDGTGAELPSTSYAPFGGEPVNHRGFGSGSCSYCHDHDGALDVNGDLAPALIVDNHDTHHGADLLGTVVANPGYGTLNPVTGNYEWSRCNVCHDHNGRGGTYNQQSGPGFDLHIRICEECHGMETLHNIQADSPASGNVGTIVVGGELPGYGHVGADGAPGASDCWGCHGFEFTASSAPFSGPLVPTLYHTDTATVSGGQESMLLLTGAAFTNEANNTLYEPDVRITDGNGASITLEPDIILDQGSMAVTIPAGTAPGNYKLQVTKSDVASNPTVISVTPDVGISRAVANRGLATIYGSGFGGYAAGSGTTVQGTYAVRVGRTLRTVTMEGTVLYWSDGRITARFPQNPKTVTVNSVFGSDMYRILPD